MEGGEEEESTRSVAIPGLQSFVVNFGKTIVLMKCSCTIITDSGVLSDEPWMNPEA